jgi:Ca2+ transporting ATPase
MKVSRRREPVIDHESMASDEQTPVEVHEIPNKDSQTEEEEVKLTFWEKINPVKIYKRRKARKIKEKKEKGESSSTSHGSVLQKKLTRLALHIGYFGMAAAVLAFLILTIKFCIDKYGAGLPAEPTDALEFLTFLTDAITVVVVAVPEGLPLAVTIALAFSVKKMLKDNNLVRHLHSCETMGNATTICSDKTGTLTTNRMTVVDSYIGQMRFNGNPPTVDDISANVLDLLKQSIAVNSNYSSVLQRPEKGLAKDSNWLKKLSRRKKPAVSSVEEADNDKHDEPPTVEELRDLVRGVDGTLVSQVGNSTECALLGLLIELGIHYEPIREQFPKETFTKQFTFNSKRKSMSTVVPLPDGGYRVYTKGASEIVLAKCTNVLSPTGEVVPLTDPMMQDIKSSVVRNMASNALRTITLAYRDITASEILQEQPKATDQPLEESEIVELADKDVPFDWEDEDNIVKNLTCIGIVGIEDPVRDEVPESIAKCQRAGISVRMVTGDNIETAKSIAEKCGIIQRGNRSFLVLDGPTFRKKVIKKNSDGEEVVNQDALDRIWPRLRVLARSSPADKYTLVNGIINSRINKSREVVAVTGDGTNDGPALKCADVGFAMGIAGTDVAKEACDIILTDDNFASIVKAVKWGRNVYDAISKFLQFQLTVNVVAVTLVLVGSIAIGDPPLRAIQLLWVNLVMDTFASLALATEPPTDELLKRKPYGRKKPLISRRMFLFICGHSFFQLVTLIVILFRGPDLFDIDYGEHNDYFAPPSQHFTIIFNTFVFMQIFNEFNARKIHGEQNIFSNMHTNYIFIVILLGQIACQVIFVEVPFINNQIFKVTNLPGELWLWCIFLASLELVWGQILTIIPIERLPPIRLPWKKKPEPGQPGQLQ